MQVNKVFILIGPSGVGKNTLVQALKLRAPFLSKIPTSTTRKKRLGEVEGEDYFFLSDDDFDKDIEMQKFIQWQIIHGNKYGLDKEIFERCISQEKGYLVELDVLGAFGLKKSYSAKVCLIFIMPPSIDELKKRLMERGNVTEDELKLRLGRVKFEYSFAALCDHVVVNDDLHYCIDELFCIIQSYP